MKPDIRPNIRQQTAMMIEAMQVMESRAKLDREDRIAEIVAWTITGLIALGAIAAAWYLWVAAAPRYGAYHTRGETYETASRPMTVKEFNTIQGD